jgi:predicted membrane protein
VKIILSQLRGKRGLCLIEALVLILFIIGVAAFVATFGYWLYLMMKAIADKWNQRIEDADKEPEPDEKTVAFYQKPAFYRHQGAFTFPSRRGTS